MKSNLIQILSVFLCTSSLVSLVSANAVPKVNISYVGSGSAELVDKTSTLGSGSQSCRIDTVTFSETVNAVNWNIEWNKVKPVAGSNPDPTTASFSANKDTNNTNSTNLLSCTPGFTVNSCIAPTQDCVLGEGGCLGGILELYPGIPPGLLFEKKGAGIIVKIKAEELIGAVSSPDPFNPGQTTSCGPSSVLDNNIVEGMQGTYITEVKIKLTPKDKKKTTILNIPLQKSYDCTDPAKVSYSYATSCTLNSDFQTTVKVVGKWKAKLVVP